ncbi:helix-turn-helix domain-containing protein, partial [Frankia sp. Cr1]|uniref:helix-turn-helix domain-containing protein n=1 Tax=Frankia sp. Cr1 TaxID=3073931 RepID=UPI002AD222B7
MVDDIPTLLTNVGSGTQLAIPGALVLLPASDSGTPVADRTAWQRAVLRSCLPRAAKLVALALASHAVDVATICEPGHPALPGPAAVCSPGLVTLAAETGYSRTHVQRQIRLLRDLGWLIGLTRPAARRPASFVLSMSDSVRATASVAPAPVLPAPVLPAPVLPAP